MLADVLTAASGEEPVIVDDHVANTSHSGSSAADSGGMSGARSSHSEELTWFDAGVLAAKRLLELPAEKKCSGECGVALDPAGVAEAPSGPQGQSKAKKCKEIDADKDRRKERKILKGAAAWMDKMASEASCSIAPSDSYLSALDAVCGIGSVERPATSAKSAVSAGNVKVSLSDDSGEEAVRDGEESEKKPLKRKTPTERAAEAKEASQSENSEEALTAARNFIVSRMVKGKVNINVLCQDRLSFQRCVARAGHPSDLAKQLDLRWLANTGEFSSLEATSAACSMDMDSDTIFMEQLQRVLVIYAELDDNDFHPRYHFLYHPKQAYASRRGGELFQPPPAGSVKLALRVEKHNYTYGDWLDPVNGWPVAYHGTNADNLRGIVRQGLRVRGGQSVARVGERFGQGVYVSPDPHIAATYCDAPLLLGSCAPTELRGKMFHIVVQCRVRPRTFKQTRSSRISWLVPNEKDVRPCGILLFGSKLARCRHNEPWPSCCGRKFGCKSTQSRIDDALVEDPSVRKVIPEEMQRHLILSSNLEHLDFSSQYHLMYQSGKEYSSKRGGLQFRPPPPGSVKLALRIDQYKDSNWLDREVGWPVAYHGLSAELGQLHDIVRLHAPITNLSPDPNDAATYCKEPFLVGSSASAILRGCCYHIVVQCRVHPDRFQPTRGERISCRALVADDVRLCGLLFLPTHAMRCRHGFRWLDCCGKRLVGDLPTDC